MKLVLLITGIVVFLFAAFRLLQYAFTSKSFGEFEKGYLVGNVIMLLVGLVCIYFSRRMKNTTA